MSWGHWTDWWPNFQLCDSRRPIARFHHWRVTERTFVADKQLQKLQILMAKISSLNDEFFMIAIYASPKSVMNMVVNVQTLLFIKLLYHTRSMKLAAYTHTVSEIQIITSVRCTVDLRLAQSAICSLVFDVDTNYKLSGPTRHYLQQVLILAVLDVSFVPRIPYGLNWHIFCIS
jgi:hypothetical protein